MVALLHIAAAVSLAASALAQQPPRDTPREPRVGTATISGVVWSDDAQPKPLRRARVTLGSPELPLGRTAITDDAGAFAFDRLPAGRYTVTAFKDGYVAMSHGAARPERPGVAVTARDGHVQQVTLRLPRGGVITGTLTGPDGQPLPGVTVSAARFRYLAQAGERRLAPAGASSGTTDDRGVYRIFGLPAGDYVVLALDRQSNPPGRDLQVISEAEIRRAVAEVRARQSGSQPKPSSPAGAAPGGTGSARAVALAPVFFPGTASPSQATAVTVAKGEERSGVDFQLQYVPTSKIEGTVVGAPGPAPAVISIAPADQGSVLQSVEFRRGTTVRPDGRFSISGIPPGRYTVTARASVPRAPGTASNTPPAALWASTDVAVDGQDVTDVSLTLQRGLTISGRVVFEGSRTPPADLTKLRVNLPFAFTSVGAVVTLPPVQLDGAGGFTIDGALPVTYRFSNAIQGIRTPIGQWWLKSIAIGGREVLDGLLELRQSSSDAVVTFSDRASELSGLVRDAKGDPAPEYFVIVFGIDRSSWFTNSRRVAGVRPGADGKYAIHNLPPGEYLVAVSNDVEPGEWFDAALLQQLAAGAMRITLGEYEQKAYDVTVRPRP
jgi:hypothetical protein